MSNDYVDCGDTYEQDCNDSCWDASGDENWDQQEMEMDSIISRLREEKAKALAGCMAKGSSDGTMWGKGASYSDITSALNNSYYRHRDHSFFNEREEIWEDFVKEAWGEDSRLGRGEDNLFNRATEAWVVGFFSGIKDFWDRVKTKVEA